MLIVSPQLLFAFLLVLARVAGVIAFLPLPGSSLFPGNVKVVLALLLTLILLPVAATRGLATAGFWTIVLWMAREAGFGVSIGLAFDLLGEMLGFAAQMLGFQAGYSYINTVDPTSQVDATILNVVLTLLGGLLFFAFDLHLELIRVLARSLETMPVGEPAAAANAWLPALGMTRLGGAMLDTAVRLALPVVAVLLLLDLALALLSYVNARMQLLSLSFPIKMLITMLSLTAIVGLAPHLYQELARRAIEVSYTLIRR
ncbi:MAG TPA: flagellar biosynthetic protein FliR [Bryobacterales bacterium]|nr:flagellar biosynthetic protein FliR [Bryobacterales bacterium]